MKSEIKTPSHNNGHICPEIVYDDNDVGFNYEDDVLSDVDYDSDAIEEKLSYRQKNLEYQTPSHKSIHFLENNNDDDNENRRQKSIFFVEDEKEFSDDDDDNSDDDEEDRKIEHSIYIKLQNKKYASTLEALSILDGKLNWLEKIPFNTPSSSPVNDKDYPKDYPNISIENPIKSPPKRVRSSNAHNRRPSGPTRFYPAKHISIKIGNKTFIGFKEEQKQEEQQIKKLCNAIKEGKECRFGDKCKFLHQIFQNKPNCKYGVKCGNKKCTFIHPDGKSPPTKIKIKSPTGGRKNATDHQISSKLSADVKVKRERPADITTITTTSYDDTPSFRKIWLCKNIFKISPSTTSSGGDHLYDSIKIEETGNCRFGDHCVYAHSSEEIRQNLEECKFKEECKGVIITQIKKDDKKVRRYENNPEARKCCRLHPKERFIDFIKRIQLNDTGKGEAQKKTQ
ncbi:MAG: zinc finger CCCH domain-containing protein [Cetobacterium sp.]